MICSFHGDLWHSLERLYGNLWTIFMNHALDLTRNTVNKNFIFIKNCSTLWRAVWMEFHSLPCLHFTRNSWLPFALQYPIHAVKAKVFQGSRMYQPSQTTGINIPTLCCSSATGAQSTYVVMTQHGSFWLPSCSGGVDQNTALIRLLGVNNVIQSSVRHITSQLQKLFHLEHGTENTGYQMASYKLTWYCIFPVSKMLEHFSALFWTHIQGKFPQTLSMEEIWWVYLRA